MNKGSISRVIAVSGMGAAVLLVTPLSAQAQQGRTFLPFTETVSSCGTFDANVAAVVDKEYQTVDLHSDGTLVIAVTGELVLRFTNLSDPNKSVVADSPGPYTLTLNPDGSGTFVSIGLGINSFDPGLAATLGVPPIAQIAGRLQITFNGPTVTSLSTRGHVTDICSQLA